LCAAGVAIERSNPSMSSLWVILCGLLLLMVSSFSHWGRRCRRLCLCFCPWIIMFVLFFLWKYLVNIILFIIRCKYYYTISLVILSLQKLLKRWVILLMFLGLLWMGKLLWIAFTIAIAATLVFRDNSNFFFKVLYKISCIISLENVRKSRNFFFLLLEEHRTPRSILEQ